MYNLYLFILQNEYSIKTNRPIVKFSYPFLKIHKLVSRFHKFERWKKIFHIHKKCPWYTKMRFFKDSLSSTYYYYFTTVEETRWERQGQFYCTKNENRFKKSVFFYRATKLLIFQNFVINNSIQFCSNRIYSSYFYSLDTDIYFS